MADETNQSTYVAREADLNALREHWAAARAGEPRTVHLVAPLGGGKRALTGELARQAVAENEDTLIWRAACSDEQDGVQTLVRLYAGLFQALHRSPSMRGRVEMALSSQLPHEPRRVQGWYQAFIEGMKKGAPKAGSTEFQVILPRDNPLIGLVEIAKGIARRFPIILDLQAVHNCHSVGFFGMLEAFLDELLGDEDEKLHLLAIWGTEPVDEVGKRAFALPLLDLLERRKDDIDVIEMGAWGEEEVAAYLASQGIESSAADIARISGGRPGFIAELVDWLKAEDKLGDDLSGLSMTDIADLSPDEDELELDEDDGDEDDGEEGKEKRPKATPADAENVAFTAALLGLTFPSGLAADIRGLDRESVDDLLDATEDVYKELQFVETLGSWVYQFHKALLRESVLARHSGDEARQHRLHVAQVIERFLAPRGYVYVIKALRLYAEAGEENRSLIMRSMALGADKPQMWAMTNDMLRYFDEVQWPDAMRRASYLQLMDALLKQGGNPEQAEGLFNEANSWATEKGDRRMQATLLYLGSQLDLRRQDLYRARDRAQDAAKLFGALEDKVRRAEVLGHLATIELNDGNVNAARDNVALAEELAPVPPIQAQAEFIRGHVARQERKLPQATEHFRKSNEIAGRSGLGNQALQAGLALGETLFLTREHAKAADVLTQVARIANQVKAAVQERTALALLGQSQAALGNFEAALAAGKRTLELTRALKFERFEPVDLFNLGFYNLQLKSPTEAVSLFRQSRQKANPQDGNFMKELLFHMGHAMLQIGQTGEGEQAVEASIAPATQAKDWRKVLTANSTLASVAEQRGNVGTARARLQAAIQAAESGGLKEDRKRLRRQLDQLKG